MTTYLITYDLKTQNKDYNALYDLIKSLGEFFHPLESTWFLKSNLTADELSTKIKPHMCDDDLLFVVEISNLTNVQGWLPKTAWEWLSK